MAVDIGPAEHRLVLLTATRWLPVGLVLCYLAEIALLWHLL